MQRHKTRKGFTLVELVTAAAAMAIVLMGIGAVLFHAHQSWNFNYERVHGDVTTDAYAAKRAFDSVVRKSSLEDRTPILANDGRSILLFYYRNITSTEIDGFTSFHLEGGDLIVTRGILSAVTKLMPLGEETLVRNVKDVKFTVEGANVRMTLTLEDQQGWNTVVTCSAARHSS